MGAVKSYWQTFRKMDRSIHLYLVYWAMIGFAYLGVEGVLLNIYLVRMGYGPEFIGQLLAAGYIVWALFALPAGYIGGRFGVKQAMVVGMVVMAFATGFMLMAESLPDTYRVSGLVTGWMLSWIGAALGTVNASPYLMGVTTEENRGVAFSAQGAVMAATGFAGGLLAGALPGLAAGLLGVTLEHSSPYRLALLLAQAAYLVGGYFFLWARSVSMTEQVSVTGVKTRAPLGLFLFFGVVVFFQALGEGLVRPFFNLYLDLSLSVPVSQIGSTLGLSSLLLILVSLVTPVAIQRWGTGGTLRLTTFGLAGFALLLAALPQWPAAALVYFGISGMLTVMATVRAMYGQELVHARWRTTIAAVATVGLALGSALAAWGGGVLIEAGGFQRMFILGAVLALISGGLLWVRKVVRKRGVRPAVPVELHSSGS
jgi:MFS family permease